MENGTTNVLVAGVGGQGVILASDIMLEVFMEAGYDVKKSEVHGMAMRGGIVTSHFRFGKKVYSPLIKEGEVDILFAFEQLEGLRWINHLKRDGKIIMNDHRVNPPAVNLGEMEYPKNIPKKIGSKFKGFYLVKGTEIAEQMGDARAANVVLLGAISKFFEVKEEIWLKTIGNLAAFPASVNLIRCFLRLPPGKQSGWTHGSGLCCRNPGKLWKTLDTALQDSKQAR